NRLYRQATDARRLDSLCVQRVHFCDAESDEVAWICESDDLATPVREYLEERDRASLDAVHMGYGVTLCKEKPLCFHASQGGLGRTVVEIAGCRRRDSDASGQ